MSVGSRGQGAVPSWIYGIDIVDRGLIVLFFVFLMLFFGLFFDAPSPPGNFYADTLVTEGICMDKKQ